MLYIFVLYFGQIAVIWNVGDKGGDKKPESELWAFNPR